MFPSLILAQRGGLGSSWLSPALTWKPATSPRGSGSFYWRKVFRNQDLGSGGAHVSYFLSNPLMSRGRKRMCVCAFLLIIVCLSSIHPSWPPNLIQHHGLHSNLPPLNFCNCLFQQWKTWFSLYTIRLLFTQYDNIHEIILELGFPGGPVTKTLCFHCRGLGSDPWLGKVCMPWSAAEEKKGKSPIILELLSHTAVNKSDNFFFFNSFCCCFIYSLRC